MNNPNYCPPIHTSIGACPLCGCNKLFLDKYCIVSKADIYGNPVEITGWGWFCENVLCKNNLTAIESND